MHVRRRTPRWVVEAELRKEKMEKEVEVGQWNML